MSYSNIDRLADEIMSQVDSMDAYELDNLTSSPIGRKVMAARPRVLNAVLNAQERVSKGIPSQATNVRGAVDNSVAQFGITVTRNSSNIPRLLPVALFAPNLAENGYRSVLQLPPTVTLNSVQYGSNAGLPNSAVFTYQEGINIDTIEVTCNTSPYPAFLNAVIVNDFLLDRSRLALSDDTKVAQFRTAFALFEKTLFGKTNTNVINLDANVTPDQFQKGIIDLPYDIVISAEKGVIMNMIPVTGTDPEVPVPFSVTLSGFVQAYRRF